MRRATLILNPRAGRQRRSADIGPELRRTLGEHGIAAECVETTGPRTAGAIAASAAEDGAEIVFACGGDGTVHEVIQGLVGTTTALGIIPVGTANALARNLGLSTDPLRAAVQQVSAKAARIPVGKVVYYGRQDAAVALSRFFTVMAGAGPDGALVYSLLTSQKSSLGRGAYYAQAVRLFVTQAFRPFRVMYRTAGSDEWLEEVAVSVMSARIGDLGGAFGRLTRGSSLDANSLRVVLVRPPGRIALPSWFVFGQLGMERLNPWLKTIKATEFSCQPMDPKSDVHAQVDGEWIGGLPVKVSVIPDALSLLMPNRQSSR